MCRRQPSPRYSGASGACRVPSHSGGRAPCRRDARRCKLNTSSRHVPQRRGGTGRPGPGASGRLGQAAEECRGAPARSTPPPAHVCRTSGRRPVRDYHISLAGRAEPHGKLIKLISGTESRQRGDHESGTRRQRERCGAERRGASHPPPPPSRPLLPSDGVGGKHGTATLHGTAAAPAARRLVVDTGQWTLETVDIGHCTGRSNH